MPPQDFDQFVSSLQSRRAAVKDFWQQQRDEYIVAVDDAFSKVEDFLSSWTSRGAVTIEYHPVEINEEDTGVYTSRKCIIMIGNRAVGLTPVGTQLIGTKGRIDLSGAFGRSRLVLVDANFDSPRMTFTIEESRHAQEKFEQESERKIEWVWKIVSNPPQMDFVEFNKENFLNTIMELANG